jgi:hypothetical protein
MSKHFVTVFPMTTRFQRKLLAAVGDSASTIITNRNINVSASLMKNGRGLVNTGLTREEEELYMPPYVKRNKNDLDFQDVVQTWFQSFTIRIPEEGLRLDISTNPDTGHPASPYDFICYKMLLTSGQVSASESSVGMNHVAYVQSETDTKKTEVKRLQWKKEAMSIELSLNHEQRVAYLYIMKGMGIKPLANVNLNEFVLDSDAVEILFGQLTQDFPQHIITISKDPEADLKMQIELLIAKGALKRIQLTNKIFYKNELVGNDVNEAIQWLQDPLNQPKVLEVKAQSHNAKPTKRK